VEASKRIMHQRFRLGHPHSQSIRTFPYIMGTEPRLLDRSRQMDERAWWDLWNSSYRAGDEHGEIPNELFGHVVAVMQQISNGKRNSILEVGCGTGTVSRQLQFSSYHGLDLSQAAIKIACRKAESMELPAGVNRPTYEAADFHDWPLPAEPFDVVLCIDAISCFRDQQLTVHKFAQGVPRGGTVVLTTINPFVYNRIRRSSTVRLENGPVSHWLSRNELHQLVERAGLTIVRSYTIMPRGNMGFLRIINSPRLNKALGQRGAGLFRRVKERFGLGQYRVVVARKSA
jgi:2-polyprenyl-3-methyl-5-hydroxy-6-metoxy-1,4-benzoquinol methylase